VIKFDFHNGLLKKVSKVHYDNNLAGRNPKIPMRAFFYARWYNSLIRFSTALVKAPFRVSKVGGERGTFYFSRFECNLKSKLVCILAVSTTKIVIYPP